MGAPLSTAESSPRLPPRSAIAALVQQLDWTKLPLGSVERWPQRLKVAFELTLGSRQPLAVLWGPDLRLLYNDAYTQFLGHKHPRAFGEPFAQVWSEIWGTLEPLFESVHDTGESIWSEDLRLEVNRSGALEESYFTFSAAPLYGDLGTVEGIFISAVETTTNILRARRLRVQRDVAKASVEVPEVESGLRRCMLPLAADANDLPFAGVYLVEPGAGKARWVAGHGTLGEGVAPPLLPVDRTLGYVLQGHVLHSAWPPDSGARPGRNGSALLVPIRSRAAVVGVLVAGLHPLRPLVAPYQDFIVSIATELGAMIERCTSVTQAEERQRRLLEIIEATPDFVGMADAHGRLQFFNRSGRRMLGYGEDEDIVGLPITMFATPETMERIIAPGIETAIREGCWRGESRLLHRDGHEVPVSQVIVAHRSAGGEYEFLSTIAFDRTAQRQVEDQLRESEERYRTVFENSPFARFLFDPVTLRFVVVNDSTVRQYGYSREELLAMKVTDLKAPEEETDVAAELERVRAAGTISRTFTHRHKSGRRMRMAVTVNVVELSRRTLHLVLAIDVTEREQLEAQLRQAQKMEAMGQLAGGIAHDFNNLLSVIGTSTRFALESAPPGTELHEDLREVEDAVRRGAALTRQLLTFSRKQTLTLEPVDLNEVVSGLEKMMRRLLRSDITLVTRLSPELDLIRADRAQLEQALLNLVINARDAMPQGGVLTLETGRGEQGDRFARLVVSDTGTGMDAATRARIFEPFFTTKPPGAGTGLGLAMVQALVQQPGGRIDVESEPGRGARFTLLLPWSTEAAEAERPSSEDEEARLRGTETILVVEDDRPVRESVRRLLQRQGYTVLEADDGQDALAVLERSHREVRLVLTDVVMPAMGARELARHVRERWPEVRLLFMSGYDPEAAGASEEVVAKPLAREQLLRRIRRALDRGA